jgi:hypothetical protein
MMEELIARWRLRWQGTEPTKIPLLNMVINAAVIVVVSVVVYGGIGWMGWNMYQNYTDPKPEVPSLFMTLLRDTEITRNEALDARAAADYAVAYAEAEDLTEQDPGAVERIRAARTVAVTLSRRADELESIADDVQDKLAAVEEQAEEEEAEDERERI